MDFDKDFWHFFQIAVVLNSASAPPSKMPYFYRVFWEPKSVFWGVEKSIIGGSRCLPVGTYMHTYACTHACIRVYIGRADASRRAYMRVREHICV